MQNLTKLRAFAIAACACVAILAGSPASAQHFRGYAGWHGGYGWRGGYYGGWRGGYYGWRGGYYYGGPWGWWPGYYGLGLGLGWYYASLPYYSPYYSGTVSYSYPGNPSGGTPPNQAGASSAGPSQLVIYPKNGQSQEQQGKDTFECHRWAAGQTGFDPTQGAPGNRSEYFRAQAACLEGRGYTVR
jgi:hypothetical protein